MTGTRIQHVFKLFGKFIKLAEIGAAHASGIKVHAVATSDQFGQQGGGIDQYDPMIRVVIPLEQRTQPTVAALERMPVQVKASAEGYLRAIGAEMGQPATSSVATYLNALKAQMELQGQTILPSGTFWSYFRDSFGFSAFPTSPAPTIPDSWVSSVVIV
jgi:hypothetical protein